MGNGAKSIYRITKTWQESNVTWNSMNNGFANQAIANNNSSQTKKWEDFDVTSTIKGFLDNTYQNYGFLIKFPQNNQQAKSVKYISSENNTQSNRPKLVITYEVSDLEAPVVTVKAPTIEDVLKQNDVTNIVWTATDNVGVVSCVLYFTDGTGPYVLIDSLNSNPGTFVWTVPANVISTNCKIKIVVYDEAGNSTIGESAMFAIDIASGIKHQLFGNNILSGEKFTVKITNAQGREVLSFKTKDVKQVDKVLTSLSSGLHIISITTPNKGVIRQMRIVK